MSDLLAEAAKLAQSSAVAARVGDMDGYLRAYYRHVPEENLAAAGPERVAAVALDQASLAAQRPQGRALVKVRPAGEGATLGDARTVVDIVTDDMPFVVDSVTMELARHDLDSDRIIHPQLQVRRDVAGALRCVDGPIDTDRRSAEDVTESWTHIEIGARLDAAGAGELENCLQRVLHDVRVSVEDYPRMQATAVLLADRLSGQGPRPPAETEALLRWLADSHFTFLGYREYDLVDGPDGMALVAVPGTGLGILRHDKRGSASFAALPPEVRARARDPQRLILTKANSRSTVHRPSYLDYIAIKRLGDAGEVVGEYRFLGLYTHAAYHESITRIPVLRRKLANVLDAAGLTPDSHDGQDLIEILEGYPREELFQITVEELIPIALGVLALGERRQTHLFLRKDIYGRFMSCLVYLPRDRYTTPVRLRVQEILRRAFHGDTVEYSATVGDSALARLHVVVRAPRGEQLAAVDRAELEAKIIAAVRSWDEDLAAEATKVLGDEQARTLLTVCARAIPETYKADVPAAYAVNDLTRVQGLLESGGQTAFDLWEAESFSGGRPVTTQTGPTRAWRLTIYRAGSPITLTDVLPRLHDMGLEIVDEHPYEFNGPGLAAPFWIYDFGLRRAGAGGPDAAPRGPLHPGPVKALFEEALDALWQGRIEDDGFNALVLDARLGWREIMVLRAYAKYLRQAGTRFSQEYIERVLRSNTTVTRLLVRLFESRFDPARQGAETELSPAIAEEIHGELDEVAILDHDRVLRAYLSLIMATVRTNYFTPGSGATGAAAKGASGATAGAAGVAGASGARTPTVVPPYLVFKLDAAAVPDLPDPRPQYELFVYSPRLEAVHLRFAPVARGGLRWSDRSEDFRTEILGLAKAQEVKNSVIVPSGAKGGFVCKALPDPADREAYHAEVLACYRTLISAMLDVTDNLVGGRVAPPAGVVRHDGDDPYLVVAADKGTATFSDTANDIARSYGYWLGDAFASGGSEGYDHKKMGITARGAWESVWFHFASLGRDSSRDDFTVAGIGDMSGDVFGNGMLLSRHIKLVAAFDHRHIFIDPNPDPALGFAERRRLFALPRSSWADYDPALFSTGGGVWPRTAKAVPVTPQMREALGLDDAALTLSPDQLISAILAAPVDLLWNGGVGTYVKASTETQAAAGDRANDAVRIDANQVRARIIAEGGNLGITQAARVEYALAGGLVNTDFIDNSAGVDTSDHEVNIKILLADSVRRGDLLPDDRGRLLQEMTDEVASLVLRDNYLQNRALAAARAQAPQMLHVHSRLLRKLERDSQLRRRLEVLPGDKQIAERRSAGLGITGPEFAILLAQAKIGAVQDILASSLPDDPYLRSELAGYFPAPLRAAYSAEMDTHPLSREIITTSVVNDMVDRSGTTFLFRTNEETGASVPDITSAWLVAREVFDMPSFWARLEALDGQVEVATQIDLMLEGRKLTERATRWLLHNRRPPFDIRSTIEFFAAGVAAVSAALPKLLVGRDAAGFDERLRSLSSRGVPSDLAERAAVMVATYPAFDMVEIAASTGRSVEQTAEVYVDLAERLQITRLRDRITALPRDDRWNTMARAALRDDLYTAHAAITRNVLEVTSPGSPEERLAVWERRNEPALRRAAQTLTEIWESDRFTVATLSVAVRAMRTLVAASTLPGAEPGAAGHDAL
ncbi:MAG TPA: NAD-glutamate dehydrogenase [Streptosporangiaceae bacterium]|nr:NAD-glutamate dehydrogenase [Streptosporangiaceae bacterium]